MSHGFGGAEGRLAASSAEAILEAAERAAAVVLGPGLGRDEDSLELARDRRAADRGAASDRRGRVERPRRAPRLDRRASRAHRAHASRRRARPPARTGVPRGGRAPARLRSRGRGAKRGNRGAQGRRFPGRRRRAACDQRRGEPRRSPPPAPAMCSRARSGRCSLAAWSPSRPPAPASTRISSPAGSPRERLGAAEPVIATDVIAALPAALEHVMGEPASSAPWPWWTRAPWSATAPGWSASWAGRGCAPW